VSTDDDQTESTPAEPTPAESTPAESTPAESTPAEPTPAESTPAESTPAEPGDAEAAMPAGTEVATATAVIDVAAAETARRKAQVRDRLVLPLVLPFASVFVLLLVALNISRVFLAGPDTPAVIVATVITVSILAGAALLSANRHVRTSSLVLTLSLVLVLILSAGLVTFGAGEEHEKAGPQEPTDEAVNAFEVEASNFAFQSDKFTAPAGINEIDYVLIEGSHTLAFSESELSYFELAVPGGPDKGKAEFVAGKEYTMFCTIPGHREAGMEATVTISDAP